MQRWEIKDPIHGYIELNEPEINVVDTPQRDREAVQRAAESRFGKPSTSTQVSY